MSSVYQYEEPKVRYRNHRSGIKHRDSDAIIQSMLTALAKHPGSGLNISRLQMEAYLSTEQVSQYVKHLLTLGFIVKTEDNKLVRQRYLYHVTRKGRRFIKVYDRLNEDNLLYRLEMAGGSGLRKK